MCQNKLRFDRELRAELEVEAPRVLASAFDEASGDFYDFLRGEGGEILRADIAGNAYE